MISVQACQQRKVGSEGVGPRKYGTKQATLAKQRKRYDRVCGTYLFSRGNNSVSFVFLAGAPGKAAGCSSQVSDPVRGWLFLGARRVECKP